MRSASLVILAVGSSHGHFVIEQRHRALFEYPGVESQEQIRLYALCKLHLITAVHHGSGFKLYFFLQKFETAVCPVAALGEYADNVTYHAGESLFTYFNNHMIDRNIPNRVRQRRAFPYS
jgi:hypothetical protein